MSGRVVELTVLPHKCSPGWQWTPHPEGGPECQYGTPPTPWDYPDGTVWECDCGKTWVSTGPIANNCPGFCGFRPERRLERRKRLRRGAPPELPFADLLEGGTHA